MDIKAILVFAIVIVIAIVVIINCTWWQLLIILGVIGLLIGFVVFMAYAIGYGLDNKYPEELYDPINFPNRSEESSEDSSEGEPDVQ